MFCFNPRARAGRDEQTQVRRAVYNSFNPRARAGRDLFVYCRVWAIREFQSTRPRGARRTPSRFWPVYKGFNPRARAGRDRGARFPGEALQGFNPRARAGRDMAG